MTREEALEALKYSIGILPVTDRAVSALGMAIKALSQQTEDVISREQALKQFATHDGCYLYEAIRDLPSVTPKQGTGHWIFNGGIEPIGWYCSNCGLWSAAVYKPNYKYCPNCGCRMVEPQESEDAE